MSKTRHRLEAEQAASIGHLSTRVGRTLSLAALQAVQEAGFPEVRESWLPLLQHLEEGGLRSTALAERIGVTKQAIHQMLKEVEKAGYCERVADPTDGRAQLIQLSALGWKAWKKGLKVMKALESELESELGASRLERLRRDLAMMAEALSKR